MTQTGTSPVLSSRTVLSLIGAAADHLRSSGFDEARLHVEHLLAHVLHLTRLELYLQFDRLLTEAELAAFRTVFRRRLNHEPLQYILGDTNFFGLRVLVNSDVLVPRPETELLVERAIASARSAEKDHPAILDACTGSGNIAVALAHALPEASVTAFDISPAALRVAEANAERLVPGRVEFLEADLHADILGGREFDIIVANPPYVSLQEFLTLEPEVRDFEPRMATTDEGDGLRFHRRLAEFAPQHLHAKGCLLVETGHDQAAAVARLFEEAGLCDIQTTSDYAGIPRIVEGRSR